MRGIDDLISFVCYRERSRVNSVMPADVADHSALVEELRARLQQPDGRVERDLQAGGESGLDTQTLERWLRADRQAECVLKGHLSTRLWPRRQTDRSLWQTAGESTKQKSGCAPMRNGERNTFLQAALTRQASEFILSPPPPFPATIPTS